MTVDTCRLSQVMWVWFDIVIKTVGVPRVVGNKKSEKS